MKRVRSDIITIPMLIPLIINILMFMVIRKSAAGFVIVIQILHIATILLMGIIALFIENNNNETRIYKNFGLGCIITSILMLFSTCINNFFSSNSLELNGILNNIPLFLMPLCYILSFIYKKDNYTKVYIYTIIFTIISIVLSIISVLSFRIHNNSNKYTWFVLVYIVTAKIICFYLVNKKISDPIEKKAHIWYLSMRLVFDLLITLLLVEDVNKYFYIYIIKYLFTVLLYNIFLNKFFYKSYKKEEDKLIETRNQLNQLNHSLKERNKELININSYVEKNELKNRKLIELLKDGVILLTDDIITYINNSFMNLLSINDKSKLIGKKYHEIYNNIKKEDRIDVKTTIEDLKKSKIKLKNLYKIGLHYNENFQGEIYYVDLDGINKVIYVKDISYIKKGYELRSEYDKYVKEEKIKEDFYSNISHELRTPINIIYSAIQLNQIILEEYEMDKIKKNNEIVMLNCLRLIRTINNFIDVNKITEGYLKPNLKMRNIVSIVEDISLACNEYIKKINSELIFETIEEEIYANVDKEMIERVIMNLLSNMVKYSKGNGIINVSISLEKDKVLIEVSDKGYTINENNLEVLFKKFEKADKSFNREKEGSGLGLFLCKELIELQKGKIKLESNEDIGTKFVIQLPRCYDVDCNKLNNNMAINEVNEINHRVETEFSDIYL